MRLALETRKSCAAQGTGSEGKDRFLTSLYKLNADRLNAASLDLLLHIPVNLVRLLHSVDFDDAALRLELVDDWHASIDKGLESLLDRLHVIVGTPRRLAANQEALEHDLLRCIEEEGELGRDDRALERVGLVELSREACSGVSG